MHPAYSVIAFSTASGAGYGLLVWLTALAGLGLIEVPLRLALTGLGLALSLVTVGLLSSTLHLGRPERAWRAFSQWRTSWLSREGVAAVATYVPAGVFGIGWTFFGMTDGAFGLAALLTVAGSLATVWCTGMIYASLTTIRAWAQPHVAPLYIVLALATGAVLLNAVLLATGTAPGWTPWLPLVLLAIGWVVKADYWETADRAARTLTPEAATGLGRFGTVRVLEPPHTQPNFVMREMGYEIARKHRERLRRMTVLLLFAVPALCSVVMLIAPAGLALALALAAVASAAVGVLTERWLFFAEAEHISMLYYGKKVA